MALIDKQAALDIERNKTVDTNPSHFEAHQKFMQFMDDAEVSSFGKWQWSNGFNTALTVVGIDLEKLPSTQPECKAPMSYKEQLSLDCSFCRQHECGDTLYESADWDGGVGFDYIRNIRFCPICGRKLYGYKDVERCEE